MKIITSLSRLTGFIMLARGVLNTMHGGTKTAGWNGSEYTAWEYIDSDMSGFISLCSVLGKVRVHRRRELRDYRLNRRNG